MKKDNNVPKGLTQYESNITTPTAFSELAELITQSNELDISNPSKDTKKLVIINQKILNVLSKIEEDLIDEQDTSFKEIKKAEKDKLSDEIAENIIEKITNEGDTDINFSFKSKRRGLFSGKDRTDEEDKKKKDEEDKKKKDEEDKKKKEADAKRKQSNRRGRSAGLFADLGIGALESGVFLGGAEAGVAGVAGIALAPELAIAGVILALADIGYTLYSEYEDVNAEIEDKNMNKDDVSFLKKIKMGGSDLLNSLTFGTFGTSLEDQKSDDLLSDKFTSAGILSKNASGLSEIRNWDALKTLSPDELMQLAMVPNLKPEHRAILRYAVALESGGKTTSAYQYFDMAKRKNIVPPGYYDNSNNGAGNPNNIPTAPITSGTRSGEGGRINPGLIGTYEGFVQREGVRNTEYYDKGADGSIRGISIGIGHLVQKSNNGVIRPLNKTQLTDAQIKSYFNADYNKLVSYLPGMFKNWSQFPDIVKRILADIVFATGPGNLGGSGYKTFRDQLNAGNYAVAGNALMSTPFYALVTPGRAKQNVEILQGLGNVGLGQNVTTANVTPTSSYQGNSANVNQQKHKVDKIEAKKIQQKNEKTIKTLSVNESATNMPNTSANNETTAANNIGVNISSAQQIAMVSGNQSATSAFALFNDYVSPIFS